MSLPLQLLASEQRRAMDAGLSEEVEVRLLELIEGTHGHGRHFICIIAAFSYLDFAVHRIALFADVQNLYYTVLQAHGCHFYYAELWRQVAAHGEIVEAWAYAIDRADAKQRQFQQILRNLGFQVLLKPYIQRNDGSAKGDWDVGITLDVMEAAERVEEVVLASGDGDFDLLLKRIRARYGVSSCVYGVAGLTANSLIHAADRFVPIEGALLLKR